MVERPIGQPSGQTSVFHRPLVGERWLDFWRISSLGSILSHLSSMYFLMNQNNTKTIAGAIAFAVIDLSSEYGSELIRDFGSYRWTWPPPGI